MRLLMSAFSAVVLFTLLAFDQTEACRAFAGRVGGEIDRFLNHKELWVSGTQVMTRGDIEALLPKSESAWWWLSHPETIQARLRANPLIRDAKVQRCEGRWWGCFSIKIDEREPQLVVLVVDRAWLIGQDGGVIAPLPQDRTREISLSSGALEFLGKRVPVVEGLVAAGESPDLARARLQQARRALDEISSVVGLTIERVRVQGKKDMAVKFAERPFVVTFDSSPDAEWETRVKDEAGRLKELLARLGPRAEQVREIDLAFERMAVVRPAPPEVP